MKSERRHELATNELADWITHLPDWFRQNQRTVVIGAIVIAALIAYTIFYYGFYNRQVHKQQPQITRLLEQLRAGKATVMQGKRQGLGVSDMFFTTADSLKSAAGHAENPVLAALAIIKRAEALRTELHYRPTPAEPDIRKSQLTQAQELYKKALTEAAGEPTVSAMAQYGLGLCLEDMGQYNDAADVYKKIVENPKYDGTIYKVRSQSRLDLLPQIERKVYLVPPIATKEPNQLPQASSVPLMTPAAGANTVK